MVPCAGLTRLGGARRGWNGGQGSADPQKYNRRLACNFQFSVGHIEKVKRKQIEVHSHYIFYSVSVSQMSSFPTCNHRQIAHEIVYILLFCTQSSKPGVDFTRTAHLR